MIGDLKKVLGATYLRAVATKTNIKTLEFTLVRATERQLKSKSVAATLRNNVTSTVNNIAQDFSDSLIGEDKLISWTYINPSPVAEICEVLAGQTIRADAPDAEAYVPPLHHNCETYRVGNYESMRNNPDAKNRLSLNDKAIASAVLVM